MNREELFNKAKMARKIEKEAEDSRGFGGNFEFETIHYSALELNTYLQFRILGLPTHVRGNDSTSPKIVNISMIQGDNDKKFRCVWPLKTENDNWIMYRILNKVMQYNWDKEKQVRVYHHKESFPTIFNMVSKNGRPDMTFETGWTPKSLVIMNILDRSLMDWHRENKHSRLLSKKASIYNETTFYEPGVPISMYNGILDEIAGPFGDWETYDVVSMKLKDDPWYKTYHAEEDFRRFKDDFPNFIEKYAVAPLTDEELSWDRYDIDNLFKVTTYKKIHDRLKNKIRMIDDALNTRYLEELEELVLKEAKEAKEKGETDSAKKFAVKSESKPEPQVETKTEEKMETKPVASTARRTAVAPAQKTKEQLVKELISKGWVGLSEYNEEMLNEIKTVNFDNDELSWIVWTDNPVVYDCPQCGVYAPTTVNICPKCGVHFEDDSDN